MLIATWNINSIRIRQQNLQEFCEKYQPDILALQETKVTDDLFPVEAIKSLGFDYIKFSGEKSYNGVAVFSKYPIKESYCLELVNEQKRHIAATIEYNGKLIELHNFYVPAGGDEPDIEINKSFKHKLDYIDEMRKWLKEKHSDNHKNIILVGDLNIAPLEHDVWSSKQLRNVISHTAIEREKMMNLITELDWLDAPRKFTDSADKLYSWWSYRNRDYKKSNRGRRLDHILLSKNLEQNLEQAFMAVEMRDQVKPSDHVPVLTKLKF